MEPSIGRIVHYTSYGTPGGEYGKECRAAIVTDIPQSGDPDDDDSETVGLAVLNPSGMFFNRAPHDESDVKDGGTSHWPERTD